MYHCVSLVYSQSCAKITYLISEHPIISERNPLADSPLTVSPDSHPPLSLCFPPAYFLSYHGRLYLAYLKSIEVFSLDHHSIHPSWLSDIPVH